ncbi:MAG TPA: MBG domain-containing protein, partial [Caulobacteraceae bacterium]|nr:MBG domain-containing protein [Caulobacteraceae bacterium]
GGGSHGADASVPDAANVTIASTATLDANPTAVSANGGQVTVWSDGKTAFAGQITAEGGAAGGNGGQVEVSGSWENFTGAVDTRAPHGAIGSLLLDPDDAIIDTNPAAPSGSISGGNPTGVLSGSTTTYAFSTIATLLAGADVTIQTNTSVTGGSGDITIEDTSGANTAFALSNFTGNLLIQAQNNLAIRVPVSISATAPPSSPYTQTTGTVTFQAGQNITVSQPLTLTAAAAGINGGSNASATLGAVSFLAASGSIDFTAQAPITVTAIALGGNATAGTSSGNGGGSAAVTLGSIVGATPGLPLQLLTLQAGDGLTISAPVNVTLAATGGSGNSGMYTQNNLNGGAATITPGAIDFEAGNGALNLDAAVTVSASAAGGTGSNVVTDGYAVEGAGGAATVGPWPSAAPWGAVGGIPWSPGVALSGASISLGTTGAVYLSASATGGAGGSASYDDTLTNNVAGGAGGAAQASAPGVNFDVVGGAFTMPTGAVFRSVVTATSGAAGSPYGGAQASGGAASVSAGDFDITAASATLQGAVSLTGSATDSAGAPFNSSGILNTPVGLSSLNVTANSGDITLAGTFTSNAAYNSVATGVGAPQPPDYTFSGGNFSFAAAGDILSNVSASLAAFAGVPATSGAVSISGMNNITLLAGDSVLMPGVTLAFQTQPQYGTLLIVADTAGAGVTGAVDLSGATAPQIPAVTAPSRPSVSIWGVDNGLMNLAGAYPVSGSGAYFANATYANGDTQPGVHCSSSPCGAPALTITANNVTDTYGTAIPAFTASYRGFIYGDGPSDVTGLTFTTPYGLSPGQLTPNVGTYAITPNGTAPPYYGRVTFEPGALTIGAAALTIAANSTSMTYGGEAPTLTDTITGLVNGDAARVLGTLTLANSQALTSNAGSYSGVLTVSGASNANYAITYAAGTLTIDPAPLTITANDAAMTYGGSLPSFTDAIGGLVNGDTASAVGSVTFTTASPRSGVGGYAITPSGAADPNYTITFAPGTLTINPATLTITPSAIMDYGAASPTYSAAYAGLVNGDTASTIGTLSYSTTVALTSPVGTYANAVTASGGRDANYTITYDPGALTIDPYGTLTIAANNASVAYGSAIPPFTATYVGLKSGDTSHVVTGLKFETTAVLGSNVGTYEIVPYGASAPSYYTIAYVDGVLTITAAPLTVTADNASMTYGAGTLPTFGVSVTGLVDGQTAAQVVSDDPTTAATGRSNAANYAILPNATLLNSNYALVQVNGMLTINPAPLTIAANNASMTYGGAAPTFTAAFTGLVNGDTSSAILGLGLSSTGTATSNAGGYPIIASSGTDSNYAIAYAPGTLTINPAPLTVTAASYTRTFGAANPTFGVTAAGLVNGDSLGSVVSYAPSTAATADSNVGTYQIAPGATLVSRNYVLTQADGTLTIDPATLTLALVSASVTRGDTPTTCSSNCGPGQASGGAAKVTSVYASQYTDPATNDTLVWSASGFAGGDYAFSGAPTLTGDGVTSAYAFVKGGFSVSSNYTVQVVQPTGASWLSIANPPLVVSTATVYVLAQNPVSPPAYVFTGLRGSDATLDGADLSNSQFTWTTNAPLAAASGGTYSITPAGPSTYYPVPGDPYGPYAVSYQPGAVQVTPTLFTPVTSTQAPPSTVRTVVPTTRAIVGGLSYGSVSGLNMSGIPSQFGIPEVFGAQIDTIVGWYLASQNAPHDARAINNWIAANSGSSTATGELEPFLISYLQNVETYQTLQGELGSPPNPSIQNQMTQAANNIGHVPTSSDVMLDTMICTQLENARTQAAKQAQTDYQTWLNQQATIADNNRTLTSLFGQVVAPPTSILAEAAAGVSAPSNVSAAALSSVLAGAAAGGSTVAVLSSGSSSAISAVSFGLARAAATGGDIAADVVAGAATGPAIIVTAAAAIAVQGIIAVVDAAQFPSKLNAAVTQAESFQSINQLMGSSTGQVGLASDLAGILAAGLPGAASSS